MKFRWTNKRLVERGSSDDNGERFLACMVGGRGGYVGHVCGPTTWWIGKPPPGQDGDGRGLFTPGWTVLLSFWPPGDRHRARERWENSVASRVFSRRWHAKRYLEALAAAVASFGDADPGPDWVRDVEVPFRRLGLL